MLQLKYLHLRESPQAPGTACGAQSTIQLTQKYEDILTWLNSEHC